jgi:hypothetical protein
MESGFYAPSVVDRAIERVIGGGRNRQVIEDALELVPPQHLEALLAHRDFCVLCVPQIPYLGVDSYRREAIVEFPAGLCYGRRILVSGESRRPVATLLHEIGHAIDFTAGHRLARTFGARLFRIFENLEIEIGRHFRSDSERFAEGYSMALSPSWQDEFFNRDVPRDLKQLLAGVLQEIRTVRV